MPDIYNVTFELRLDKTKSKPFTLYGRCPELCNSDWTSSFSKLEEMESAKESLISIYKNLIPINITKDGKVLNGGTLNEVKDKTDEESAGEIL